MVERKTCSEASKMKFAYENMNTNVKKQNTEDKCECMINAK